jgi:hypothetical protein
MKQKQCITIIDSFVHNSNVRSKLIDCINKLKKRNHDILLISNTKIDPEIQEKVNFFIYDSRNQLFEYKYLNYLKTDFWKNRGTFIVHDVVDGLQKHGLSVLVNLFNAVSFSKLLGYTYFQRLEVDDLMGSKSLDWIDQVPYVCKEAKRQGLFYFNERNNSKQSDISFHYFYCNIDLFLEKVPRIRNEDDYKDFLMSFQHSLDFMIVERFLYEHFKFNNSLILKRPGSGDVMATDFPDTIWNTETTPSNMELKHGGCITKLYRYFLKGIQQHGVVVFTYNYGTGYRPRKLHVIKNKIVVDTLDHVVTGGNQWYFNILPEDIECVQIYDDNRCLEVIDNKNVDGYIDFL